MNSKSVLLRGHFAIPRASQLKRHLAVSDDGLLKNSTPDQFNHDIRCHRLNTSKILEPVVTSTTAKELTATDREYTVDGVSLSPAQYANLRHKI